MIRVEVTDGWAESLEGKDVRVRYFALQVGRLFLMFVVGRER